MTQDGLDEGLINRLREKYANMSKNAPDSAAAGSDMSKGSMATNEPEFAQDSPPAIGTVNIACSGSKARICGVCSGSGERCYEYNYRQMTEQCKHCDGNGLLDCRNAVQTSATSMKGRGTFVPGTQRVMTQQQQYFPYNNNNMYCECKMYAQVPCICRVRVKALTCQIAKLDLKISALEDERQELTQQIAKWPDQEPLKGNLIQALDQALSSLRIVQQNRQDRLSYYDGMVEPEGGTNSTPGESSDHGSIESTSAASSTGTTLMDSS